MTSKYKIEFCEGCKSKLQLSSNEFTCIASSVQIEKEKNAPVQNA
ncbi:MAG: hypothetical protein ACFFG0_00585 [Candidatus Thorarchaeota archaeon]